MADDIITVAEYDTCDCVISYSWQGGTPEATRVHTAFCVFLPDRADDPDVLAGRYGVCPFHEELDVDLTSHPGNAQKLIRLDWHVRRATPLFAVLLAENRSKTAMYGAVKRALGAGDDDEFDFAYEFSGTGAGRSLVVASADLPAQSKAAVRVEAAKQRIPVTVE